MALNVDQIDGSELQALNGRLSNFPATAAGAGGKVKILTFAGTPTGAAPLGTLAIDTTNALLYICTVISGTWTKVGTQT